MGMKAMGIDSETSEVMNLVSVNYNTIFSSSHIGTMRKEALHYYPATRVDKFDEYTVVEFFILYKIDKMVALGNIDSKAAELLKKLVDFKKQIEVKVRKYDYEKLMKKDKSPDSEEISLLRAKIEEIDEILKSYNLTIGRFNFDQIITSVILAEGELDSDIDELNGMVKSIGQLNIQKEL